MKAAIQRVVTWALHSRLFFALHRALLAWTLPLEGALAWP